MSPYPVNILRGNTSTHLWDNAARIIQLNDELRRGASGMAKPWPVHLFAPGRGDDGCVYALDLGAPGTVWWIDRCHVDTATKEVDAFEAWASTYLDGCREYLAERNLDPDGTPEDLKAADDRQARSDGRTCLVWVLVIVALLTAAILTRMRS